MPQALPRVELVIEPDGAGEGWRSWQAGMASMFEIEVDHPEEFRAGTTLYSLGPMVCGPMWTVPQRYKRSRRLVARTGLDQYMVQLCQSGTAHTLAGHREMSLRPGMVGITDFAQTCESVEDVDRNFSVMVPRSLLDDAMGESLDLHGLTLTPDTVTGRLFCEYLETLEELLPRVNHEDASTVADGVLALLVSALR
ncbi:MAG: hypothetical protein HY901_38230, partial [Deltaproteobacteria bacterium]|nr:hypothetical protein [Deltaproteobacteria bacterium]